MVCTRPLVGEGVEVVGASVEVGDVDGGVVDVEDGVEGDVRDLLVVVVGGFREALEEHVPDLHGLTLDRFHGTVDVERNFVRHTR